MAYNENVSKVLSVMQNRLTLNQIVRQTSFPRYKVINLLACLISFGTIRWEYDNQQFLFSLT